MSTKTKETEEKKEEKPPQSKKTEAEKRFIRDRLIRGEAVKVNDECELPPGVTHRIVENSEDEEGLPDIERERFSIY